MKVSAEWMAAFADALEIMVKSELPCERIARFSGFAHGEPVTCQGGTREPDGSCQASRQQSDRNLPLIRSYAQ